MVPNLTLDCINCMCAITIHCTLINLQSIKLKVLMCLQDFVIQNDFFFFFFFLSFYSKPGVLSKFDPEVNAILRLLVWRVSMSFPILSFH